MPGLHVAPGIDRNNPERSTWSIDQTEKEWTMFNVVSTVSQIDLAQIEAARQARRNILLAVIASAGSRFLSVDYAKKDGTITRRVFQTHAGRALLAGDSASDSAKQAVETRKANNPHLVSLYDMTAHGWRSLNLDTTSRMAIDGKVVSIPEPLV